MNPFLCLGSVDKLTWTWGEVSEGISQYWTVEQIFQQKHAEYRSLGHWREWLQNHYYPHEQIFILYFE